MPGRYLVGDREALVVGTVEDVDPAGDAVRLGEQVRTVDHDKGARVQGGGRLAGFGLEQRLAVDVHAAVAGHYWVPP
ncbi:hypothetical protein D9M71_815010 [compost metagenome]